MTNAQFSQTEGYNEIGNAEYLDELAEKIAAHGADSLDEYDYELAEKYGLIK